MFPPTTARDKADTPIGILVVDDQLAVRKGLARLISSAPMTLRFVSTACTGDEALSLAVQLRPDVVVLDVDLAGEDGLSLVTKFPPGTCVLVLTSHGDRVTRARANALGVGAFIEKHQPAADILNAIIDLFRKQVRGDKPPGTPGTSSHREMVASSDARKHFGH